MSLVKAGRYKAKVIEHGITETSKGLPQAAIRFGFETDEGYKELVWFGSFKDKALEFTLQTLVNCGLKGNNPADPLEIGKEVSIVVEVDKDQDGHDRNIVRWVNKLGGVGNKLDDMTAKSKLERFSGAIMAIKQREGNGLKNHAPQVSSEDEFGF
jgi:hypothetical protein